MGWCFVVFSAVIVGFLAGSSGARDPYPVGPSNSDDSFRIESMHGSPGIPGSTGADGRNATSTRESTSGGGGTPSTGGAPGRNACSYAAKLIFRECRNPPPPPPREIENNIAAQRPLERVEPSNVNSGIVGPPEKGASVTYIGVDEYIQLLNAARTKNASN